MTQYVTRRLVLGSIISGLAVGPFLIRSLLRKKNLPEQENYVLMKSRWSSLTKEVIPAMKLLEMSQPIPCGVDLEKLRKPRYTMLIPVYDNLASDVPDCPNAFMEIKGTITTGTLGDNSFIQGENTETIVYARTKNEEFPKENPWVLRIKDTKAIPALFDRNNLVDMDWTKDPDRFSTLAKYTGFVLDCPKTLTEPGETWNVNDLFGGEFIGPVTRQFVGVYEIAGRPTVKVTTKQDMDVNDALVFLYDFLKQVKEKTFREQLQNEINNALKMKCRVVSMNDSNFDIETGLLVYRKYSRKFYSTNDSSLSQHEVQLTRVDL